MLASVAGCWWRPFRRMGDTFVIHVDLRPHAPHEVEALRWLDEKERSRWKQYQHTSSQRRYALCRAALRAILCSQLGCRNEQLTFGASIYGKPFALVRGTPAPISFNVSHSDRHGLLAFAGNGRLGIDVEERVAYRDLDRLSMTVFAPSEQAELASVSGYHKIHLFFALWTIKEALIKALGTGLSLSMSKFEVPVGMRHRMPTGIFQFPHMPTVRWQVVNLSNEHFAAAMASELDPHKASEDRSSDVPSRGQVTSQHLQKSQGSCKSWVPFERTERGGSQSRPEAFTSRIVQ